MLKNLRVFTAKVAVDVESYENSQACTIILCFWTYPAQRQRVKALFPFNSGQLLRRYVE